jgi:DNA-binding NtrC family response regulator
MTSRVLLVAGGDSYRKVVADFLRNNHLEVDEVSGGEDTITKLYRQNTSYAVVVYDSDLPHLDRIKLALAVRLSQRNIALIGLSTGTSSETSERVLFEGRTLAFMRKPIVLGELLSLIRRVVPMLSRRKNESQTWHVCSNCIDWPLSEYEEQLISPSHNFELCNECRIKLQEESCTSQIMR